MSADTLADPRFAGVFTAITTPFTADGSALDLARLDEQVRAQGAGGVRGVVVAGTTGESPTLDEREWRTLLERCVAVARPLGLLVVAGTGSNSTAHACHLQKAARSLGADAALSVNPYYNKPGQDGLVAHFLAQADASDLPVVLYNIPGRSGVALSPPSVERIARDARVVAIKEATGSTDSATDILARCPRLALLSGDDGMTLPFLSVGGVGVVSVASNVVPGLVAGLVSAWRDGRAGEALRLHRRLTPLLRALFAETNPIPVKAALEMLGRDSGSLRLPMTRATPATRQALDEALRGLELR